MSSDRLNLEDSGSVLCQPLGSSFKVCRFRAQQAAAAALGGGPPTERPSGETSVASSSGTFALTGFATMALCALHGSMSEDLEKVLPGRAQPGS